MTYRGQDLDLRTPQSYGAGFRESSLSSPFEGQAGGETARGARPETIYVDDALMRCCNDAYDLALVHRSVEVGIVHLMHAMTQSDAANAILSARGVSVVTLRRETGEMMASDLPLGQTNGKASPRKSSELEEVLRLAARQAYARRAPAGIEDVVSVLFEAYRDAASTQVLRRHTDRPFTARSPIAGTSLPPLRGFGADEPRERVRAPSRSFSLSEPPRPRAEPVDVSPAVTDRLAQIERGIETRFSDLSRGWSALGDRLVALEGSVESSRSENLALPNQISEQLRGMDGIERKLELMERTFSSLADRLVGVERSLERRTQIGTGPAADLEPVVARLTALERSVTGGMSEGARNWAALAERLKSIEKAASGNGGVGVDLAPMGDRLRQLEDALAQSRAETRAVRDVLAQVNDKLAAMSEASTRQRAEVTETVARPVMERVQALISVVDQRSQETSRAGGQVNERLGIIDRAMQSLGQRSLEVTAQHEQDIHDLRESLVKLNENQQAMASAFDQWRTEISSETGLIASRLGSIEVSTRAPLSQIEAMNTNVQRLLRFSVMRAERRSKFVRWLFGTEDWYSASWHNAAWQRAEQDKHAAEEAPAPRFPQAPADTTAARMKDDDALPPTVSIIRRA